MNRRITTLLAALSSALFAIACIEELIRAPDNDFSIYWASNGRMISIDSFEDTLRGNAITIRRFSPMPADVPLHFQRCSVEIGNEAPTLGVGNSVAVSLDQNSQPVGPNAGDHLKIMRVSVVAQLSLDHVWTFIFFTGLVPLMIFISRFLARWKARLTTERSLCPTCGYDLRATPDRCPECGSVPAKSG